MPNTHAGVPRRRSHRRILLMLSPVRGDSLSSIAKGVARYFAQHEKWEIYFDTTLASLSDHAWPGGEIWDGVISEHTPARLIETRAHLNLPLVALNPDFFSETPSVVVDHTAVGRLGAEHLVDRGVLHFAFCGFSNQPWSRARCKGFLQTLQRRGRHCSLIETPAPELETSEWNAREIEALSHWLADAPKPLGIMACNDTRGAQLIHAADAAGLSVPEDVAVLGANNSEMRCELIRPALSSIAINEVECGYKAAEMLHRLMDGLPVAAVSTISPLGTVTRGSTDLSVVHDRRVAIAIRFIQEHGCEPITIADVCRHAGIARTQLEQKFRALFARSPQAEVRRVRLDRIRKLLHETDLPLKTIAEMTGFEHVEYMSVFCKKALGESPGRYRRRVQGIWTDAGRGAKEMMAPAALTKEKASLRQHPEEMDKPSLTSSLPQKQSVRP